MTTGRPNRGRKHETQPAFEQPLQLLAELHGRLQSQCGALERLQHQLAGAGAGPAVAVAAAAGAVRRSIDRIAGPLHQDEEQDLFPALLESMAGSDAVCIRQMIEARAAEHREIEDRWLAVSQWLEAVEAGRAGLPRPGEVEALVSLLRSHLAQEDQELLPLAERLLSEDALADIGDGMRRRHHAG